MTASTTAAPGHRPDFIVVGAMKCGTSTLADQLAAQPGLFMTTPKEPNYFSDDAIFARGPAWYAGLFAAARPGDIRGEASTHYTKRPDLPHTVARMKAALPELRLVYMIRDPLARLVSHYIHEWTENRITLPIGAAVAAHPALVDYGLYGWQIAPFVQAWGAEAICLTSLERLTADPQAELERIARHVGHAGPVTFHPELDRANSSANRARKLPFHNLLIANPVATALRRALVPKALRRRIRDARKMQGRPELPPALRAELAARFAEDRARLAAFFPGDPSLDMAYPFLRERAA